MFFGLRTDLEALPEVRPAKVELHMAPVGAEFAGFRAEEPRVDGFDLEQVRKRQDMLDAGVRELHVAGPDGAPAYGQWLVRPGEQEPLLAHSPGAHPVLAPDEVLLEGAYTFREFRRMGAMGDGMAQLLRVAREEGFRSALTYVEDSNVASLRGCAGVGFELDHVRVSRWRLLRHSRSEQAPDAAARAAWDAATARR